MINPYNNEYNVYTYTIEELKMIDNCWNLIDFLSNSYLTKLELRENIISYISKKYSINDFEKIELSIEKMYWNMVFVIKNKIIEIQQNIHIKKKESVENEIKKIYKKNKFLSESYINKILVFDNDNIYFKKKYPDVFDKIMTAIMFNRNIYETIYYNIEEFNIKKLKKIIAKENINIPFDYFFPNLNSIKPFWYTDRLERVKKYYYLKNHSDIFWFTHF